MLQKENLSDIIRLLAGFLLSLKLLFNSFGVNFITNDQIDAIVNVISFLFILYFGYKNNYVGKKEPFIQVPFYHCRTTTSFVCSGPYDNPLY
ncbi:phage holin [Bacillus fungorum]|uniref:phage holin n=1 Tax=Bacillus fungorum TaxID=2039284 RepID=UPI00339844FA